MSRYLAIGLIEMVKERLLSISKADEERSLYDRQYAEMLDQSLRLLKDDDVERRLNKLESTPKPYNYGPIQTGGIYYGKRWHDEHPEE